VKIPHHARVAFAALSALGLFGAVVQAAIPSTEFYPFPGYDVGAVRNKTKAEWSPESAELIESWKLYHELQGAWAPGAPKPRIQTVEQLNQLRGTLEARPKPQWFSDALKPNQPLQMQLADKVGDPTFEKQRSTPDYQALKALAIVYLAGHELDQEGAAKNAGSYLMALSITHPWDWEVHGLYSRFLVDARSEEAAWNEAQLSVFLNPEPSLDQLKAFAFVGSIAAKARWSEIQKAIRQAAGDDKVAELAIVESDKLFSRDSNVSIVTPAGR
jgi:hypothetical protein